LPTRNDLVEKQTVRLWQLSPTWHDGVKTMLKPARVFGFVAIVSVAFATATAIAAIGKADAIDFTAYTPAEIMSACVVNFADNADETAVLADGATINPITVSCGASSIADASANMQNELVKKGASMAY
jgi:hypothetical protein